MVGSIFLLTAYVVLPTTPTPAGATIYDCAGWTYRAGAQDLIVNGGFENDLDSWSGGAISPTISTSVVHSGAKAAKVDAVEGTATFAAQTFPSTPSTYVFSHWFYVEAWGTGGHFTGGVFGNTSFSQGFNDYVSILRWWAPNTTFRWDVWVPRNGGGGVTQDLGEAQSPGSWRLFEAVVDSPRGAQCLYIDGVLRLTASVSPAAAFPSRVATFGDTSQAGDPGIGYYDDISLRLLQRVLPDLAVSASDFSVTPSPPLTEGSSAVVNATVRNAGDAPARSFDSALFVDLDRDRLPGIGEVLGSLFSSALDAGGGVALSAPWTPAASGTFDLCTIADSNGTVQEYDESNNVACMSVEVRPAATACPLSQGFWKTHPAAWPVDSLVLGNRTYTKEEMLKLLWIAPGGDASLILAHQLIAAKLNVAAGADPVPIQSALSDADTMLSMGGTLPQAVRTSSALGQRMVAVADALDAFNDGRVSPGC